MKSLLFKEYMFNQILAKNKTQTRRVIRTRNAHDHLDFMFMDEGKAYFRDLQNGDTEEVKARYQIGDICYLKEPYCYGGADRKEQKHLVYKFSCNEYQLDMYKNDWNNKLFMKEIHARYFVHILDIEVEPLQNISIPDCLAEGIEFVEENIMGESCYTIYGVDKGITNSPYFSFNTLWKAINKKAPNRWDDNPYTWAYTFELVDKETAYQIHNNKQ